jgi:succinate dehydrogenase/fumarate reductase flavoprotein subunit
VTNYSEVLIIGAGFSGIGAAYRIREKNRGCPTPSWNDARASAEPGTCSAIQAFGPTATSSRCAFRGSRGRDPR